MYFEKSKLNLSITKVFSVTETKTWRIDIKFRPADVRWMVEIPQCRIPQTFSARSGGQRKGWQVSNIPW